MDISELINRLDLTTARLGTVAGYLRAMGADWTEDMKPNEAGIKLSGFHTELLGIVIELKDIKKNNQ